MLTTAAVTFILSDYSIFNYPSVLVLLILWSIYRIGLGIYRVTFSPIAKFPGSKLAAVTTWYQGYYDAWLQGQYWKRVEAMHAEYGPIIRINPYELHVSDPDFIDELYAGSSKKRDKPQWVGRSVLLPDSTGTTIPHDHHRRRRAALNPYFSKASIRRIEPIIQKTLEDLLEHFSAYARNGDVMPMRLLYVAATSDIITGYTFDASVEYLKKDDLNARFFESVWASFEMAWWIVHIPLLGPLMNSIPAPMMGFMMPGLDSLRQMQRQWHRQIKEISESKDLATSDRTVFHGILKSDLPRVEKSLSRLQQEAQQLVLAGQDTTAATLASLTFELLANPDKLRKLKDELAAAILDPNAIPTATELEQLPYLSAVIQEGLRLHPHATARLQRVCPDAAMVYRDKSTKKEWLIPAGTGVSMDSRTVNMNSTIFPEPQDFVPERWIDNPRLDKYLMTFSKGTRICLGINLAYAELYMMLGGVFRKYNLYDGTGKQREPTLALYDTVRERDVDTARDLLVSFPTKGSKGVRIIVRDGCST